MKALIAKLDRSVTMWQLSTFLQLYLMLLAFLFFLCGGLISIGIYYINRFEKELDSLRQQSEGRANDFYDKYEDIQRSDTEIKLILERLKTEHEMQLCKREPWK